MKATMMAETRSCRYLPTIVIYTYQNIVYLDCFTLTLYIVI